MVTLCLAAALPSLAAPDRTESWLQQSTQDDRYGALRARLAAQLRALLPEGAELIDAHTHLGRDEDGRELAPERLIEMLERAGIGRACTFPLHDPERRPAFRVPNDRVLTWAAQSGGRLIPFCRLDPAEEPLAEARRCLAAGARGIKLHPRAQAFTLASDGEGAALEGIFALAGEAGVPILIHAGRGLPPIAEDLAALALRHPDTTLILAHAAICDQGRLSTLLAEHPRVLYDTSCFHPLDVLSLLARVPAERIVLGSDPPYGDPSGGLLLASRCALRMGLSDAQLRLLLGGTMAALLAGAPLPAPSAPRPAAQLQVDLTAARLYGYLATAAGALFAQQSDRAVESIELALTLCEDPQPGALAAALELGREALELARAALGEDPQPRRAIALIHLLMVIAATDPLP
ncbi:MAG TPA: amidohydrolase family protein [Solirubrobacteraceae bacterium]|nr:amidohydrolase family protein [Solirubrobacteraceae bacterium]